MNLSNCPQCGKVYVKNSYNICPSCLREVEEQYDKCVEYLRNNRACTLNELSEATGVPVKTIIRFIREGRIATKDAPNVLLPCEMCGEPVKGATMCESCRRKLSRDVQLMREREQRRAEQKSTSEFGKTYIKNQERFDKH